MSGAEFPKAMYRDGGAEMVWGSPVQTRVVADAEDEERFRLAGWRLHPIAHPLDHDGDGKPGGSLPRRRGRPPKVKP